MAWVDITARPRPEGWNREKGRGGERETRWSGPVTKQRVGKGKMAAAVCALCMPTLLGGEVRTTCFLALSLFPIWKFDIAFL